MSSLGEFKKNPSGSNPIFSDRFEVSLISGYCTVTRPSSSWGHWRGKACCVIAVMAETLLTFLSLYGKEQSHRRQRKGAPWVSTSEPHLWCLVTASPE